MVGWRATIGVMVPSSNTTMESELWRMAPEGVAICTGRLLAIGCDARDLRDQDAYVEPCAKELGTADPDLILFGCTSGSFLGGPRWERDIRGRIEEASGVRAITATGAVLDALRLLDVKRISLLCPYVDEVAALERSFFEERGYETVSAHHMGLRLGRDIRGQTPQAVYRLARRAVTKQTQALFISCTNLRTIEVLEPLERDLGIPVISSNQCGLWSALRETGISQPLEGFGSLLRR